MSTCPAAKDPVARIAQVEPGSIAEEVELQPGDLLLAVNDAPVRDYLAYRAAITEEVVVLRVARGEDCWEIEIEKDEDEDLGLGFAEDVFDGMRRCANRCVFCFENQMPAGMRSSLNTRDDDYRLSFLHGNFITLTNLRRGDMARILREHLSPLYVSVHATDPAVRRRLLGNPKAPDIRAQLDQLAGAGIEVHAQIVLCPGWNDGSVLAETLDDLTGRYPCVQSVGIVPVGLTAHRPDGPAVRVVAPNDAEAVLEAVTTRQAALLATHGTRLIFAADEFYLMTGRPIPPSDDYEDYPQRENGIGLSRIFLDEMAALRLVPTGRNRRVTLATGILAAPLLENFSVRLRASGWDAQVIAVPNCFYGGGVNVAGLLTGRDLLDTLRHRDLGDLLLLPTAIRNTDGILLDDTTPESLEAALGVRIAFAGGPKEAVGVLKEMSP